MTSKLDYGNAVLCGINGRLLQKLQGVKNSAVPRPPPHHASIDSATLAAGSMAHNIQDSGFDLPSDTRSSARIHLT